MNNYFYIGEEKSQKPNNENQEIQRNNDKFDNELKKLNDQAFNCILIHKILNKLFNENIALIIASCSPNKKKFTRTLGHRAQQILNNSLF